MAAERNTVLSITGTKHILVLFLLGTTSMHLHARFVCRYVAMHPSREMAKNKKKLKPNARFSIQSFLFSKHCSEIVEVARLQAVTIMPGQDANSVIDKVRIFFAF